MKRWNISILVIFVLLASSLLGILAMNFVQQMMKQSALVYSYYKTYYLSKAGIELGLVEIGHRGIWFEYTVNTGDAIVLDNFSLSSWSYALSMNISGMSSLLSQKFWQGSGCEFPYVLNGGESLIVPLFRDTYTWSVAETFVPEIVYQNLADLFKNEKIDIESLSPPDSVTFGLLILSWEELADNGIFFRSWSLTTTSLVDFKTTFENYMTEIDRNFANYYWSSQLIAQWFKMYLLISNTAQIDQSLCLHTLSTPLETVYLLPTDTFFIQSQASYSNQNVSLDASYAQPIPSFLFNISTSY